MSLSIYGAQFSPRQNILRPQLAEDTSRKKPVGVHHVTEEEPVSGSGASDHIDLEIQQLIKELHCANADARYLAARTFGDMGEASEKASEKVVPALAKALSDKEPEVRHKAAWALGEIGKRAEKAIPGLVKALSDEDSDVRYHAVWALKKIGEKAIPGLVKALSHADPNIRYQVRSALIPMRRNDDNFHQAVILELIKVVQKK